jgi:hypothetical protein
MHYKQMRCLMRVIILLLLPVSLLAMDHPICPATPRLSALPSINIEGDRDYVTINITGNHRDLESARASAPNPIAQQLDPLTTSRVQQLGQIVANNKTLILSNLATACLGTAITLIVHFTAAGK